MANIPASFLRVTFKDQQPTVKEIAEAAFQLWDDVDARHVQVYVPKSYSLSEIVKAIAALNPDVCFPNGNIVMSRDQAANLHVNHGATTSRYRKHCVAAGILAVRQTKSKKPLKPLDEPVSDDWKDIRADGSHGENWAPARPAVEEMRYE